MKIATKILVWAAIVIFTCGILYASIIKIPGIEAKQNKIDLRVTTVETHYVHIKESLGRIETKVDKLKK